MWMGWAALAACAALLCLAAIAPGSALAGSISGTVTDASTHEPIQGLEVCAYPVLEEEEFSEEWFCEETDTFGDYAIGSLEPGEYWVEFWGRPLNYIPQYFDGKTKWWERDPIVVGSGDLTEIDAEMIEGGGIEGTVEVAAGGPVGSGIACAWNLSSEEFGGCALTDSNGDYWIKGMSAGEYEVEFLGEGDGLLRQYYDHKDHWWEADAVSVSLGAVTTGIDADLLPAAKVEGTVRRASTGAPVTEVEVCAWSTDPEGTVRCTSPGNDGRYVIGGLPGDDYKVEFWPYDKTLPVQYWNHKATWAQADVLSLAASSVASGIDADLGPPPSAIVPPVPVPPTTTTERLPRRHCKKGFRKKRVKGKVRCVKRKKRKHHRQTRTRPGAPSRTVIRPGR